MKALVIPVNGEVHVVERDNFDLTFLQQTVGGYIELVSLPDGADMYINEEGKLEAFAVLNTRATVLASAAGRLAAGDVIVGDAIVVGHDGDGNTISAPNWILP